MKLINKSFRGSFILGAVILLNMWGVPAWAGQPGPPDVSILFVPLEGEVTLSNGDVVTLSGEAHVLTQTVFSDTGVPSVGLYVNLVRVEGTSPTTGTTYLLVGASNREIVGIQPGPPNIPEQTFNFSLVPLGSPPEFPPNPIRPVFLRNFVFAQEAGSEGVLLSVEASFL